MKLKLISTTLCVQSFKKYIIVLIIYITRFVEIIQNLQNRNCKVNAQTFNKNGSKDSKLSFPKLKKFTSMKQDNSKNTIMF